MERGGPVARRYADESLRTDEVVADEDVEESGYTDTELETMADDYEYQWRFNSWRFGKRA